MATLDDALEQVKRDPIAGYIAIAVIAARPPRPGIVVKLKGRNLLLPDWTQDEWAWYGSLAFKYADSVDKSRRGAEDVSRANQRLSSLAMFGPDKPSPEKAAAFYDAAVRLVIAAHVAGDPETGVKFVDAFKAQLSNIPGTIIEALRTGLTNMTKVQREAAKIAGEIFSRPVGAVLGGLLAGLGPLGIALIAGGAYYLWKHR